ncbi:MAG: EAL domain-containing protein [Burkholderiales bacterium]
MAIADLFPKTAPASRVLHGKTVETTLVYAEQVRLLYRLSLVGYLATLMVALALGAVLWNELSPRPALFVWLTFISVLTIARYGLYKAYMSAKPSAAQSHTWGNWFVIGTGLMGFGWAIVGTLLFPLGNLFNEMSVVMLVALLTTGALAEHAPFRPAFVSYVVPALVPLALHMLLLRDRNHVLLGLVLLALAVLLLFIHTRANAGVIDALTTRFRNLSLASNLETERQQAREAVMALQAATVGQQLAESHALAATRKLSLYMQHSPLAAVEWDMNFCVTDWNQAAENIFGYKREQMLGRHAAELVTADGRAAMKVLWDNLASHPDGIRTTANNITADGRTIICDWFAAPTYDTNHKMVGMSAIINDITERTHADKTTQYLANHDALTGLPNRRMTQERLAQSIAQAKRGQRHVAVLYLDLDRFKLINDTLGHEAGDSVLRTVAQRLSESVREEDTVSREGGDEFIITLPNLEDTEHARVVAGKILRALAAPFEIGEHRFSISASIGVSFFPDNALDAATLVRHADTAMYKAKEAGRNTMRFFSQDLEKMLSRRLELETSLRHAIEHKEFSLQFQPQLELATGRIRSMEALLRWKKPSGQEEIAPRQFISVLEEMGLIAPVGEWVIRHACDQSRLWQLAGHKDLIVSVNLSSRQLLSRNLIKLLRDALNESGIDPARLEFEITESAAMRNPEMTAEILAELGDLGVGLALDQFGIGHSSLSELKRLPVRTLKIARNFIDGIPGDKGDCTITETVIAMAKRLGLRVVAVGVESEAQMNFLRAIQCDAVQGFLYSRPLNISEADTMLRSMQKALASTALGENKKGA